MYAALYPFIPHLLTSLPQTYNFYSTHLYVIQLINIMIISFFFLYSSIDIINIYDLTVHKAAYKQFRQSSANEFGAKIYVMSAIYIFDILEVEKIVENS